MERSGNGNISIASSDDKPTNKKKGARGGEEVGTKHMLSAPTLSTSVLKKTIANYYKQLEDYKSKADSELSLRNAFQNLLADTARHVKWTLVAEQTIEKGVRPDGVVRDEYQVSKDPRSGIESDPNRLDDEQHIVHLVEKVVTVSVETVRLVKELAEAVKMEDWMEESVESNSSLDLDATIGSAES
jgi:hypothetical protein